MTTFPPSPKSTDSNLDHALLYHSMGGWVFPGYSPLDEVGYRQALIRQGMSPEDAYQKAKRALKHTFEPWAERRKLGEAGRPTEAEIREWFDGEPARPVIILTGPGATAGGQLVGVDVDTIKGGDAAPWIGPEVTMLASTPRGGFHAYHFTSDAETVKTSQDDVGPGIDIRGAGGLLVAPSGEVATPGRVWLRWGPPSPAPLAEIRKRLAARGKAKAPLSRAAQDIDPDAIPDAPPPGEFVQACTQVAPPGKRQGPVGTLVGNLARRCPLPHDMVEAALDLLIEARGDDPEAVDGWREALEADSRSLTFTLKVLHAWNKLRVSPPWSNDELETTTRSLWNTSLSREMATNAARSIDVEPEEVEPEETQEEVEAPEVAASEPQRGGVFEPPTKAPLPLTPEQQQEEDAKTRAGLDEFAPTLADAFNPDAFDAVLSRAMIPCGVLPPWREVRDDGSVVRVTNTPNGHGFGEVMDDIIGGGLKPGFMAVVGAEAAKVGKTAIMDQWMDGILLRSVEVLRALAAGEKTDEPIIVRYDLSEMNAEDLTMRQLGRWIGIDSTAFRRGRNGHKAPGVKALAVSTGKSAEDIFARYKAAAKAETTDKTGDLYAIRKLRRIINPRSLRSRHEKAPEGGKPQDHRRGVLLLRDLATGIDADLGIRAREWGVSRKQVIPLIFIDPIQRFQSTERSDAVGALDELVEELRAIADELGAIVFCTSDTNKESAKGPTPDRNGKIPEDTRTPPQIAAGVFRGSYKLLHLPDVAFVLRAVANNPRQMELLVGINRWNGQTEPLRFDFERQTGRYTPAQPETTTPPVARPLPPAEDEDEDNIPTPPPEAKDMHPSLREYYELYMSGLTTSNIAARLGKDVGTVSKGLKRIADSRGLTHYRQLREVTHVE